MSNIFLQLSFSSQAVAPFSISYSLPISEEFSHADSDGQRRKEGRKEGLDRKGEEAKAIKNTRQFDSLSKFETRCRFAKMCDKVAFVFQSRNRTVTSSLFLFLSVFSHLTNYGHC